MRYTITGRDALRIAERDGVTLGKYADPVDGVRVVTIEQGRSIAREDAGLLFIEVEPDGWNSEPHEGYHVGDYFDGQGYYLGPDHAGVEPTWRDADDDWDWQIAADSEAGKLDHLMAKEVVG